MTFQPGTRLGSHEIVAPIGEGGMGEVYRARDTRLGRDVALKVLPAEMASSPERLERFQREARAVAALNHPHIVTIYSVEESSGVHFLTMELVEGTSLDLLIAEDALPVARLVEIATALTDALSAAHEKGIVHRDLKPANVMVGSGGRVKVLDFGLAKVASSAGAAPVSSELQTEMKTQEGVVMGTVPYMSPEQVQGRPLDHRTDIFSLGVILYEMATGQRPFHGQSSAELVSSILRDTPPSVAELRVDLPVELARVIERCLEKSVAERFPSAQELRYGLRGVPTGVGSSRGPTASVSRPPAAADSGAERAQEGFWVAVLPFKQGGADADLAALAEGLTEEIATGLSRFRYLSVVSSASAARLKGEAGDERVLGSRLGARYVLEGSLRKGGSAIRVSAQLVDTGTGARLWSETYNRDLQASSVFGVQDDVAARIVATVADSYGVLVNSMRSAMRQKDDVDLTPVEWQFQYFAYREQITPSAYAALKSRLQRAVERDGRQSALWACLAQIYVDEYAFGFSSDATALDRALAAARRAVELDRANQFALVALAQTHFFRQDLAAFGPAAERAMALNPLNTDAVGILGLQLVHTGEFERGTAIVRRAMEVNPNHAGWMHFAPLWEHFHKGEYEQALECANRVDVPGLFWPYLVVASACGHLGRRGEAEAAVRDLLALDPEFAAHARSNVANWHFASGLMDPILEGLRKAGLAIPASDGSSDLPRRAGTVTAGPVRAEPGKDSGSVRADEGFWVAVLPFKYGGANADLAALADGLSEEIVTGLSRFSYLRVIARSSTSRYANEGVDVRTAGKELGARYVMEGTLRQAGTRLRLAVQVLDAVSGAHLWAENFERAFSPETLFELQDDLVPRIVSTVADMYGVLTRSMSEALRGKADEELSPHEAVLRAFGYMERVTPEEHARVRRILERAVRIAPNQGDAWAMLANLYWEEHAHALNPQPDPLGRALAAARRAVEAAPANNLAHYALACTLFFQKDFLAFRSAAERALELNRMDSSVAALVGNLIAYAGDWERGVAVVESAMRLNPHHPGWYWFASFNDAYRRRDYRGALGFALKINLPGNFYTHAVTAAAYGQLGMSEAARKALQELLAIRPDFAETAREEFERWNDSAFVEHMIDGLRKAGLEIAPEGEFPAKTESDASRSEEGFWVAVLPFKYGANADLAALADGLSEEIVTGLSRFSYLRVIARSSTSRYAKQEADVRSAGRELGARYVMEGTLRQAGARLRLAVQLVDAASGAHLWAETFERAFRPDAIFELQDELVPRIVSTVADMHGVLARSMSEALRSRTPEQLSPNEAVLRSFCYFERITAEELAAARSGLESALQKAPAYADAWALLALLNVQEYAQGFDLQADSLTKGSNAARAAVEAAPSNHLAYFSLAQVLFFQRESQSFRNAAERAVTLNPMDGNSMAFLGELLIYAGDRERGLALAGRAKRLNPHHPGWYWYADFYDAYRRRDYTGALGFSLKANMPGHWGMHAAMAAAHAQLGERDAAAKAMRDLLKLRPGFADEARTEFEKWWEPSYVESFLDGLRKAGLDIPAPAPADVVAKTDAAVAIAVLPFSDMSLMKDQDYLCEGMAEEIMNALTQVAGIRVASRTSAFRARRDGGELPAIAHALSVGHVLEGSVRTSGSRLRVTAQLTDAASGFQLWSQRYDREAADIFAVQDEIAAGVVEAVKTRLAPGERTLRARPQVGDLEAYRHYLKGRHLRYTKNDHGGALRSFEQATTLDPSHGPSWVGLADVNILAAAYGLKTSGEAYAAAKAALQAAAGLQGESAEALYVEGMVAFAERRWKDSERLLARATKVEPGHVQARCWTGILLCVNGRTEEALRALERAREIDPLAPYPYAMTGLCLLQARRPEETSPFLDQALAFDGDNILALWVSGAAQTARRLFDPAIARLERAVALSNRGAFIHGTLGWALAAAGRTEDASAVLAALRARPAPRPTALPEAWMLAVLGDREGAWQVLDRVCDEKQLLAAFTGLPGLDPLRTDPRFDELLERLGLPSARKAGGG